MIKGGIKCILKDIFVLFLVLVLIVGFNVIIILEGLNLVFVVGDMIY